MWPGASSAWRKRQPATKPRLGINLFTVLYRLDF
ncbi:hypothetical protein [Sporisorium scitamineum]|uniref:Uncharacterized protein n=1 Tax=Sporisorium scitamineum TaxID=49012 RepID=A0A0F7S187_9BASI|nr:hypothetical protein [Sporisorium scitamineum]